MADLWEVEIAHPWMNDSDTVVMDQLLMQAWGRRPVRNLGGSREGEPFTERMVLLEFPDRAAALAGYNDPDYQYAAKFRRAASKVRVLLQEGRQDTAAPDRDV
jgi:uncharacterized protein (DUF1330 family)